LSACSNVVAYQNDVMMGPQVKREDDGIVSALHLIFHLGFGHTIEKHTFSSYFTASYTTKYTTNNAASTHSIG
jgi:hypothetical protein